MGDELPPTSHAGLHEDRLQVVLHRVRRYEQRRGNRVGRLAAHDLAADVLLARSEPVCRQEQVRQISRVHRLDGHGDLLRAIDGAQWRGSDGQPCSGAITQARLRPTVAGDRARCDDGPQNLWDSDAGLHRREPLVRFARESAHAERSHELSAEVVLGQARSLVADLLAVTGLDPLESTDQIPHLDD